MVYSLLISNYPLWISQCLDQLRCQVTWHLIRIQAVCICFSLCIRYASDWGINIMCVSLEELGANRFDISSFQPPESDEVLTHCSFSVYIFLNIIYILYLLIFTYLWFSVCLSISTVWACFRQMTHYSFCRGANVLSIIITTGIVQYLVSPWTLIYVITRGSRRINSNMDTNSNFVGN